MENTAQATESARAVEATPSAFANYVSKMRGGAASPARQPLSVIAITWVGSFIAIAAVALLGLSLESILIMGSFGATCTLVFGFPDSPFSQPRNVIGGHFIATFVGLFFLHFVGPEWWSMAAALATAIALMQVTRTVHPPAGSNPLIVFLGSASWQFLITPSLAGSIAIVLIAIIYNNLPGTRKYPSYWI